MVMNITKKTIISKNHRSCTSHFSKSLGFMFSKNKKESLIFTFNKEKRHSLHMFFVFFSIDVLFLNKHKTIVDIKENFKQFTYYKPTQSAKYVIELPIDSIKKSKTKIGDKVSF